MIETRSVPHPDRSEFRAHRPSGGVQSPHIEIDGGSEHGGTDIR